MLLLIDLDILVLWILIFQKVLNHQQQILKNIKSMRINKNLQILFGIMSQNLNKNNEPATISVPIVLNFLAFPFKIVFPNELEFKLKIQ